MKTYKNYTSVTPIEIFETTTELTMHVVLRKHRLLQIYIVCLSSTSTTISNEQHLFSSNSKANASELLENHVEMFPMSYIYCIEPTIFKFQSHNSVLSVAKLHIIYLYSNKVALIGCHI